VGGKESVGSAKLFSRKGKCPLLSNAYKKHLSEREISAGYHLACQTLPLSDVEVIIPVESLIEYPKILLWSKVSLPKIDPLSRKYLLRRSSYPYARDKKDLMWELKKATGLTPHLDEEMDQRLLSLSEEGDITITLSESGKYPEIIQIEPGDRTQQNYGLAVDLGTTTIVVSLVNLNTGEILDQASGLNTQITYGEELVSRLGYATEAEGLHRLHREAVKSLNALVMELTARNKVESREITDVTVGGNTVMNHFLAEIDTNYLGFADAKVSRGPIVRRAGDLGIKANPKAYVFCLPNVSRFLGGDVVGDILTSGMHTSDEISLLIDMGTNGEIVFGNREWFLSCSVPSGPAYEGYGIKFGMRGRRGGIEHVKIDPNSLEAKYEVIGDLPPRGICGSGVIDLLAEMYSTGILDFSGKIKRGTPLVREGEDGPEYVVVPAAKSGIKRDIVITQKDIDYVMDSKATVCGGISTLMKKLKISIEDVKNLYLAGAFGMYMDPKNALRIGIFPEFPNARISQIGNGSAAGAYLALISRKKREEARDIARKMGYIDLLTDLDFMEEYREALYIPGKKELFPTSYAKKGR
jgi:uncharacterized 2Fe-2S/4Fe-4S cluster protein (DUF4445 family)